MHKLTLGASIFLLLGMTIQASKILILITVPSKSHFNAYAALFDELPKRGHEVTVVSAHPRNTPLANYTDISIEDVFPPKDKKRFNAFDISGGSFVLKIPIVFKMYFEYCGKVVNSPQMQKLIKSDLKFDLVLYEPFFTECTYGLIHKFKAPSIQILPNSILSWSGNPVGNPSTTSYVPEMVTGEDTMDFLGRLKNFATVSFTLLFRHLYYLPKMQAVMEEAFPDPTLPSIEEIEAQASFLFLHSHPVLNCPRPFTSNTIEVGGLHIKRPGKLPQDLQSFLDGASDGAIYFSLGSNVQSADMPEYKRNALIKAFSKLKEKVLWKWETDSLPGQPKNVRVSKWFPQNEILAHPNVKLFITHGGLMSTQEATYFGKPLIAVPIFADQRFNALHAQNSGYAILLDLQNITEESVSWALREALHEPRYRENAKRLSDIFRDQPQTPLERAIYWIEYTIRHNGAPHLRSAALDLNFFQFYLLDVIAVLAVIGLVTLALLTILGRKIARTLCLKSKNVKSESKSKKHD